MKTCPICSATTFEDMEMCFSCLHRFDEVPEAARRQDSKGLPEQAQHGTEALASLPLTAPVAEGPCEGASMAYRLELTLVPVSPHR